MNQFRRIVTMSGWFTGRTFRSVGNVLWIVVVPVVLGLFIASLFANQGNSAVTLNVVNEDGTPTAERLVEELLATALFDDVHWLTRSEAEAELASGEADVALVLPEGFAASIANGTPKFELLRASDVDNDRVAMAAAVMADAMARGAEPPALGLVHTAPRGGDADGTFAQVRSVFGIYMVFAMVALFIRSGGLHTERSEGTLQRIVATGVPYGEVVVAHVLSVLLVGALQALVVFSLTSLLGVKWLIAGWLPLLLTLAGTVFVSAALAVCFTGLTRTLAQVAALAGGLPTLLGMLAGAFFPLEVAPPMLQSFARINPCYWIMRSLDAGFVYEGPSAQLLPLAVLMVIGVLGIVLGVQSLRRKEM